MQELITVPNLTGSLATDTQKKLRSIVDDINSISKSVFNDNDTREKECQR